MPESLPYGTDLDLCFVTPNAAGGRQALPAFLNNPPVQFGKSGLLFKPSGLLNLQQSSAGLSPGATGADNVVAMFSLPANTFDVAGRGIRIIAAGQFASNGDTKTVRLFFNPSTAVIGSTIGAGGSMLANSAAITQNGSGFVLEAEVFKFGAAGSNTQVGFGRTTITSAVAPLAPVFPTATESGAILVAMTANCATATTDVLLNAMAIFAIN